MCPCDVEVSPHEQLISFFLFLAVSPVVPASKWGLGGEYIQGERETPVYWQLMEMVVSQGRILTLAPFCKSFAPVANNLWEGLCVCGGEVWVCVGEHLSVLWQKLLWRCSPVFFTSFNMAWSCFICQCAARWKLPRWDKGPGHAPQPFLSRSICLVSSAAGEAWGGVVAAASTNPYCLGHTGSATACSTFCKSAFWWQFPVSSCCQSIHTERTPS